LSVCGLSTIRPQREKVLVEKFIRAMPGAEVAGLVLGAIPICVTALDLFTKGIERKRHWQDFRYKLVSLGRILRTHHSILENTCRNLLVDVVPDSAIDDLINAPNGPGWKDAGLSSKLQNKLGLSLGPCLEALQDIHEEIQRLRDKLEVDQEGKVCQHLNNTRECRLGVLDAIYDHGALPKELSALS
jgi:hypothetical protein